MKKIALTVSFIFFVFLMYGATFSQADNTFAAKILEYFPQADTNKDGVLSEDEEAAVSRRAIQRYPKADVDGDGSLSDKEKEQLLKVKVWAKAKL